MVSNFTPAQHQKPQAQGIIARLQNAWNAIFGKPPAKQTTEEGAASAASPSTYGMALHALRYERRAAISECWMMYEDDPRCRKSVDMFAREAGRGGFTISITKQAMRGMSAGRARIAQECATKIQDMLNPLIEGMAKSAIIEGDLFMQWIVFENELVDAKRMPASSMERLSDDTDEFPNPLHAFEQVDVASNETKGKFALWQIGHYRWNWIPGQLYGQPEMLASRRLRRLLQLVEEAQVVRRMTRAPKRTIWNIGTDDKPADWSVVEEFKSKNGFVDGGEREMLDPENVALDYFGNGLLHGESIGQDEGVADIEDILYFQNILSSTGYPTPPAVMGLDAGNVNRDTLQNQRAEWLKQTAVLTDLLKNVVKDAMDLALMLRGVHPSLVHYKIQFSESSIETPGEIMGNILKLRQNTVGTGASATPDPMISKRTALSRLAEFQGIEDVDQELEIIEEEEQKRVELSLMTMQTQVTGHPPVSTSMSSSQARQQGSVSSKTKSESSKSDGLYEQTLPESAREAIADVLARL